MTTAGSCLSTVLASLSAVNAVRGADSNFPHEQSIPLRPMTMRFRVLPLRLLGLVLLPQLVAAQTGERVPFNFGWKPGIVATLSSVTTTSGLNAAQPDDTTSIVVRSTMKMTVEAHPQGLLVRTEPLVENGTPSTVSTGTSTLSIGAAMESAMIVTANGRFVAIGDTVKVRRMLDSMMAATAPRLTALPPAARAMFDSAMSMPNIESTARQGWDKGTGRMLARAWRVGESITDTIEVPLPMMPGKRLQTTVRTTLVSLVPCDVSAPVLQCALLRSDFVLDHATMRSGMTDMLKSMGIDSPDAAAMLPETSSENTTESLLEVASLLPRRTSMRMVQNTSLMGTSRRSLVTSLTTYNYISR